MGISYMLINWSYLLVVSILRTYSAQIHANTLLCF
ncbi:UNVERIFIED_CONTAM: hypothetical protein GTU68_039776 [Idotea baltica]|nr:hypothetical protein [Idotea baltica]